MAELDLKAVAFPQLDEAQVGDPGTLLRGIARCGTRPGRRFSIAGDRDGQLLHHQVG